MAWEMYLRMESTHESFVMLQILANDCYRAGHFFYSLKAFDVLERLDPAPECDLNIDVPKFHMFHIIDRYWEGKRGAAIGVFQLVIAGKENRETLTEVITMLRNTQSPQVEYFVKIIGKWIKENLSH